MSHTSTNTILAWICEYRAFVTFSASILAWRFKERAQVKYDNKVVHKKRCKQMQTPCTQLTCLRPLNFGVPQAKPLPTCRDFWKEPHQRAATMSREA
jgi:hypothetical protein